MLLEHLSQPLPDSCLAGTISLSVPRPLHCAGMVFTNLENVQGPTISDGGMLLEHLSDPFPASPLFGNIFLSRKCSSSSSLLSLHLKPGWSATKAHFRFVSRDGGKVSANAPRWQTGKVLLLLANLHSCSLPILPTIEVAGDIEIDYQSLEV